MCTYDARFLEPPIPIMEGWKVLKRSNQNCLGSPYFYGSTRWEVGKVLQNKQGGVPVTDPMAGFHFFPSRLAAWWFKNGMMFQEVHRVRAYNVFAVGKNSSAPFGKVYVAERMELLR